MRDDLFSRKSDKEIRKLCMKMKMVVSLKLPWCLDLIEIHDQNGMLFFFGSVKSFIANKYFYIELEGNNLKSYAPPEKQWIWIFQKYKKIQYLHNKRF